MREFLPRLLGGSLFVGALLGACQQSAPPPPPPDHPAAPAGAPSAEWPVFVGDNFEVRMPGPPAVGPEQTAELGKAAMTMRGIAWISPSQDAQFGLTTFDFPTVPLEIAPLSQLYVVVRDRVVAQLGGTLTSDIQEHIYSHEGDVLELQLLGFDGGPPGRISGRFFAHGKRIYFLSVTRRGGALTEEAVRKFLDSFHLTL